jgi:DNA invertase Pin-like site-specific DNA recombinase
VGLAVSVVALAFNGRHELAKMLKALEPGDVVLVTKLDRFARSTRDLLNLLAGLKDRNVGFVSLGEAWCDTTTEIGKLVTTIMAGVNEFERGLIQARCQAGIERARAKGTHFGPKFKLDSSQRRKIAERYAAGETMAALARDYGVGEATVWRVLSTA